jgi:subtilisin family serine protease
MAGIVPNISLMNIYADLDNISSYKISRGIMWAVNNGADIINCSWGAHPDVNLSFYNSLKSEQLEEALDSALYNGRNGKGCVVVFAAGNEHRSTCSYPASYNPDLLVVGSVDITGELDNKSNWGPELDIVAPGDNIMVYTNYGKDSAEGTSLAAPHVAAVAGMILSLDRNLTREQVVRFIERSAQRIPGPNLDDPYIYVYNSEGGFRSEELAHGLLDANNAINTDFSDQIIRGTCKIDGINIFVENLIPRNNPFIEMKASRNVVINKDFNLLKQSTLLINTTADLENYTIVWPLYF